MRGYKKEKKGGSLIHVIDDNQLLRETITTIILTTQLDCLSFESGQCYLDYMESGEYRSPKVVLSDVRMQGINGYELTLKIRESHPDQKIILMSGESTAEFKISAEIELCSYIFKPFQIEKLIAVLNNLAGCVVPSQGSVSSYPERCVYDKHQNCPFHCKT